MAVKKYSVKILRHLELLWSSVVLNICAVLIYVYIIGVNAPLYITVGFFGFFLMVNLLPVLILHTQYLIENKEVELIIDKKDRRITYKKNGKFLEANFSDIVELSYCSSYGRGSWYTFADYEFCKISFSNKTEIFVTCLLMKNVKNTLEDLLDTKADARLRFLALLPIR